MESRYHLPSGSAMTENYPCQASAAPRREPLNNTQTSASGRFQSAGHDYHTRQLDPSRAFSSYTTLAPENCGPVSYAGDLSSYSDYQVTSQATPNQRLYHHPAPGLQTENVWRLPGTYWETGDLRQRISKLDDDQIEAVIDVFREDRIYLMCGQIQILAHELGINLAGMGGDNWGGVGTIIQLIELRIRDNPGLEGAKLKRQFVFNLFNEGIEAKLGRRSGSIYESMKIPDDIIRFRFRKKDDAAIHFLLWLTDGCFTEREMKQRLTVPSVSGGFIKLASKLPRRYSQQDPQYERNQLIEKCQSDLTHWQQELSSGRLSGIEELNSQHFKIALAKEQARQQAAQPQAHQAYQYAPPQQSYQQRTYQQQTYRGQRQNTSPSNMTSAARKNTAASYGANPAPIDRWQPPLNTRLCAPYYTQPEKSAAACAQNKLSDNKIPADSPILWQLSQEVTEWKFLGRYLDLDEDVIEEIDQYTRPNKTRDKSLKVLTEWVNSSSEATWKALGEALQDAGNTLLYEKLTELLKNNGV